MRFCLTVTLLCGAMLVGCGTTKWSDTARTATEQLLISDAMDQAVGRLDFRAVAGKTVYLDTTPLSGVTDAAYLTSLMRQHMLAAGCILKEKREEADYVAEIRAGAVGTDRRDVLFGVPATKVPSVLPVPGAAADVPEMRLATKTEQRAVAKIAVFAYNRKTGRPVWQSGVVPVESKVKNVSVFGAGPFQRGTIFEGTKFAGTKIKIPLISRGKKDNHKQHRLLVTDEAYFAEPKEAPADRQLLAEAESKPETEGAAAANKPNVAEATDPPPAAPGVVQASHTEPAAPPSAPEKTKPPAASPAPETRELPAPLPAPQLPQPSATSPPAPDSPLPTAGGPAAPALLQQVPAPLYLAPLSD